MEVVTDENAISTHRIRSIDGLRGFAVIAVVFYHSKVSFLPVPGGFVGVDVFFVISGYVVCKSLQNAIDNDSLKMVEFYARRIVRLFPMLFLTLALTILVSYILLYPFDFVDVLKSVVSINFLAGNVWFWKKSADYFNQTNSYSPLIHTWSLGVEEQFYLLFPILLLVINRVRSQIRSILVGSISLIFALLSILLSSKFPNAVFYLMPFRVWEFALGSCVYFLHQNSKMEILRYKLLTNVLQLLSFSSIIAICFTFNPLVENVMFAQMISGLASASLILLTGHRRSRKSWILSNRLIVAIGVISYSLYLLHQPVLTFLTYEENGIPSTRNLLVALLCIFVVSFIAHRVIEVRLQRSFARHRKPLRPFLAWTAGSIFLVSASVGLISLDVTAHGITSSQQKILDFVHSENGKRYEWKTCFLGGNDSSELFAKFCAGKTKNSQILMFGDSHAAMIASALKQSDPGIARYSSAGCPPILAGSGVRGSCRSVNDFILAQISQLHPKIVLMKYNWLDYATNGKLSSNFLDDLKFTIASVKNASPKSRIIVLGSTPEWSPNLPVFLVRTKIALAGNKMILTPELPLLKGLDLQLLDLSNSLNVGFYSYLQELCHHTKCMAVLTRGKLSQPFAFDYGHTTQYGSSVLANLTKFAIETDVSKV